MKPTRSSRKLHLHRESLRQMTPRQLSPAELAQVVGGLGEGVDPTAADNNTNRTDRTCPMTSVS